MNVDINKRKSELENEIQKIEKEKSRSLKWFLINLFVLLLAFFAAGLILWLVPKAVEVMTKKFGMLDANGKMIANLTFSQQARLDYIKWGTFVFVFGWVTTWVFWALFRFRKWTSYQHKIDTLKEELKKLLEKEK